MVLHETTLVAWGLDGDKLCILDIVETSNAFVPEFIEQFRNYAGIKGYTHHEPNEPWPVNPELISL